MPRKNWARNPDSAPDPRKKGQTMHRGAQKLTRKEAAFLSALQQDGWDTSVGDDDGIVHEYSKVSQEITDLWVGESPPGMITQIPDDLRRHIQEGHRAVQRGRFQSGAGQHSIRLIKERLDKIDTERQFVNRILPWVAPQLDIGQDTVERITDHLTAMIDEAESVWRGILHTALESER